MLIATGAAAEPVAEAPRLCAGPMPTEPQALYARSAACFDAGKFEEALDGLKRAYAQDPAPNLLYNMARAHEGLGELSEALAHYERYLEQLPSASNRGAVEGRIAALRDEIDDDQAPSIAPWVLAGAGVIGLGIGVGFGVAALATQDEATAEPDAFVAADARDEAEQHATVANVALIAGAVLTAAGLTWGIVDLATWDSGDVSLRTDGVWVRGTF